ncbi:MAG: 3-deoxy-D-manno-octulosonic acid transferase [Gammaproteobacteria bacterium]
MPPARLLYTLALYAASPFILIYAAKKRRLNRQCFGFVAPPPSASPVVWLHAVSVGEAAAAGELVEILRRRGCQLVLTHTTAAGGEWLRRRHGEYAYICALPLDFPGAARRFMRRVRPQMAVIMEKEYWPNLLAAAKNAGAVLFLANARLGRKAARRYARVAPLFREMAGAFNIAAAQTRADARRLAFFGAPRTIAAGNLKFDRPVCAEQSRRGAEWRRHWPEGKTAVLVAGSRRGEEEILLRAMDEDFLRRFFCIFAPRHPERGDEVAALLAARGLSFGRRSRGDIPAPAQTGAYLADTLGEMDAFYACSDAAAVCGSFLPFGGQNPIEAMASGVAAVIGPHAENYRALVADAVRISALQQAENAEDAVRRLRMLAADEEARLRQRRAAKELCARHGGALQTHARLAAEILDGAPVSAA